MDPRRMLARSIVCLVVAALGSAAFAQQAVPPAGAPDAAPPPATEPQAVAPERFDNPYAAYSSANWEQALQGFADQQVEHPENPEVALNLGSVHYEMKNYEEAERNFASAVLSGEPAVRNQALYNLGNSAYRQGKLQEAVELYMAALEADPDDEDAKFNLEFVRDEIRRRHEEAQKRQQEQQQGDQQQQQQGGDQQQQQQQQPQAQDRDGDGLPDELERTAQNPTDPENPDSDQDGLVDGQEDQNRNGQVDEQETDPNNPDSDGDGISDGEEAEQQEQQGSQGQEQPEDEGLTPEEAERYLQALEEGRPDQRRAPKGTRRARPEKDW